MRKINLEFSQFVSAIERCPAGNFLAIDLEKEAIVKLPRDSDAFKESRYLLLPIHNEKSIMELFTYSSPPRIQDKLNNILDSKDANEQFNSYVSNDEKLKKRWHKFKAGTISDHLLNWLWSYGLEARNEPKTNFRITEESFESVLKTTEDGRTFSPRFCSGCKATKGFETRYFRLKPAFKNLRDEAKVKEAMKERYGISKYGMLDTGKAVFLVYAKCGKCGSADIIFDI